ncbi:hypothetical protein [Pleomorphovibrio marinus]|uniref:hypothetical protein n=1 Tax=Pleomorphovibrio marinus TaxID=2164132 RepID=UPI000E0B6CFC|nr:hypothetical protein [Pleomorphovibrio marinus]
MKKNTLIFLLILLFSVNSIYGQDRLNIEIYGGPTFTYMSFENQPSDLSSPHQPYQKLTLHGGVNFLPRISPNWQLSIQAEMFARSIAIENAQGTAGEGMQHVGPAFYELPTFALGARYTNDFKSWGFFFQPSVGISLLPIEMRDPNPLPESVFPYFERTSSSPNPIGLGLRAELGAKRYFPSRNYFVMGIRHHQGLMETDEYSQVSTIPGEPMVEVMGNSLSSYTGIFIGFGFNTDNWRPKRTK